MPNRLWSANEIAAQLPPGTDFDTEIAFVISHVSAATLPSFIAGAQISNGDTR